MKLLGCELKLSNFARLLLITDIFRAGIISSMLFGIFCGMGSIFIHKKSEITISDGDKNVRVDFYRNRSMVTICIFTGVLICAAEILLALALDNILRMKLQKTAGKIWMALSLAEIIFRIGFKAYIYKHQKWLGFDRIKVDNTHSVDLVLRSIYISDIYYEVVRIIQLMSVIPGQNEMAKVSE